ncbi:MULTISPECIES: capsular polysaccharide synthesis protein [Weissella]|uniref:capsular polysaccharide synthesis protein n=1 Tax=Weissella TaxID=46255 RepID=UPI00223BB8F1|nr:capsular polysaccharide synthesis protein [Weissella cibaria]MCS8561651.1 hypothetical protein [Weissella cibaria]MCS8564874.1 hypothetical protein [Weissella cibaria]MCS8575373.1 hypothetical protein [Weissella cibaria]
MLNLSGISINRAFQEFHTMKQFLTAGFGLLVNGTSKTSLELIRMQKMLQVKNKLARRYKDKLVITHQETVERQPGDTVWVYWNSERVEDAPLPIQAAVRSIKRAFRTKRVVVLNDSNLEKYITIPQDILTKKENGVISLAMFSDIVRLNLLIKHGGIWLDSTVLVEDDIENTKIYKAIDDSKLFFFQNLRPGRMGNSIYLSSWLISAWSNDPTMIKTLDIVNDYISGVHSKWQIADYFLLHIVWHLVFENNPGYLESVKKVPNSLPLSLLYELTSDYEEEKINAIFEMMPLQKITYKGFDEAKESSTFKKVVAKYLVNKKEQ